jgi:uncharacterized membrane protein
MVARINQTPLDTGHRRRLQMQRAERSIRVAAPASEVYQAWRDFERFPEFMEHVEEVRWSGEMGKMSHWKLRAPMGVSIDYDAEITEDVPNRSIGWRSVDGNLGNSGTISFTDLDNSETEIHVILQWYDPPAGPIGEALSRILQNPEQMLEEDLTRFKHMVESGLRRVA